MRHVRVRASLQIADASLLDCMARLLRASAIYYGDPVTTRAASSDGFPSSLCERVVHGLRIAVKRERSVRGSKRFVVILCTDLTVHRFIRNYRSNTTPLIKGEINFRPMCYAYRIRLRRSNFYRVASRFPQCFRPYFIRRTIDQSTRVDYFYCTPAIS